MDTVSRAERSRIMACVRSVDTTPELVVRRYVHSLGYRYRLHARDLPGAPDIVLPRLKCVIDVRGCFWHLHRCPRCRLPATRQDYWSRKLERNAARDRFNRRQWIAAGWKVLVVWECQTLAPRRDALFRRIGRFLQAAEEE